MTTSFPLAWPAGKPRTRQPERARFDVSQERAQKGIMHEIRLMGGTLPALSTNIELRRDGLPYANRRGPVDQGVAVYFTMRGQQMCFACDRWDDIAANMQAMAHLAMWPTAQTGCTKPSAHGAMSGDMKTAYQKILQPGLWATPKASEGEKGSPNSRGSKGDLPLSAQAHHAALWTTPSASDGRRGGVITEGMTGSSLAQQGKGAALWPTPTTKDDNMARRSEAAMKAEWDREGRGQNLALFATAALWRSPTANEDAAGTLNGKMQQMLTHQAKEVAGAGLNGSNVPMEKPGQLNPEFVCWLMGFPTEWISCAPLVTRSTRALRRNSSMPPKD